MYIMYDWIQAQTVKELQEKNLRGNTKKELEALDELYAELLGELSAGQVAGKAIRGEDMVNKPPHYSKGIETYDYITSWDMNFTQGNVIKYVTRYNLKNGLEDLKKAKWYLEQLIKEEEGK